MLSGFLKRFSKTGTPLSRLEAFSDGVFAIIVTLLILEIKVPNLDNGCSVSELKDKLIDLGPKLLSWLISFFIVCKFWVNHSFVIRLAKRSTYTLVWLNCLFLMCQAFIPFPTALIGEYVHNPLAVSLFGAVFAINTLAFLLLHRYINKYLIKEELKDIQDKYTLTKSMVGPASYTVGVLLAWISIPAALVVYLLTPLFYITPIHKESVELD